jgi:hypothetical protein
MSSLSFLKILFSPFKPFNVKVYCGKTAIGVPYFYPRKWVKGTPKLAHKATLQYIQKEENYNKWNPNSARTIRPYEEIYKEYLTYSYPVPLKVGFSFCGLGYKTKWTDTDYRYEYGPVLSFVFFGYQLAFMVGHKHPDSYWQAWLYYENHTDKTKSKRERIKQCIEQYPQTVTQYSGSKKQTIDYYPLIVRAKYLK